MACFYYGFLCSLRKGEPGYGALIRYYNDAISEQLKTVKDRYDAKLRRGMPKPLARLEAVMRLEVMRVAEQGLRNKGQGAGIGLRVGDPNGSATAILTEVQYQAAWRGLAN